MSTMSELHARLHVEPVEDHVFFVDANPDAVDYLTEVEYRNREAQMEAANPLDDQPLWLLHIRGALADFFHRLAYKIDYCPF